VRVHAVATRIKRTDGDSAFAVKTTTNHVTIAQIQTPREQTPTRAKKNQAGVVNLQINIRRRLTAPLKMKKQTIQTTFRNDGGRSRRKENASGALAMNTEKKIIAPEALPQGRGGRCWRRTMTTTTAGAWSATTSGTENTSAANTSLGIHEKKRMKKR